jgi:hypothetical protein
MNHTPTPAPLRAAVLIKPENCTASEWSEILASGEHATAAATGAKELADLLEELLAAVTSKGASDSRLPVAWSGSPEQNRRMYAAIGKARAALARYQRLSVGSNGAGEEQKS